MMKQLLLLGSLSISLFLILAVGLPLLAASEKELGDGETAVSSGSPILEDNVNILYSYNGQAPGHNFGWVGANLNDLNGDGSAEFLISAMNYSGAMPSQGRVTIYSGISGTPIVTHTGASANVRLGYSAAAAGDVNNDQIPDYIIGARGSYYVQNQGQAIVYSGADHSVLHAWTGQVGWLFGASVTGIGDVDGDEFDDVAVASAAYSATLGLPFHNGYGRIFAYSGQTGALLWTYDGSNVGDGLGGGMGRVADLNGDTIPDVVAAANLANSGNGYVVVLSGADGSLIRTLLPVAPFTASNSFGEFFTTGAGDTNNDGKEDVFVGEYAALGGNGRVYIFSGLDGSIIHLLEAESSGDGLGPGRGIPDVNADNHDDIIAAAYTSNAGTFQGGKIYIYSGADGSVLHEATGTVFRDQLGVDALPLGDVNGDEEPDYLVTAVGLDFAGQDVGHAYVISFEPPPVTVTAVSLTGPTTGIAGQAYSFTATVMPLSATLPITFSWSATGLAGETAVVSDTNHVATFTWVVDGPQMVTVTATNEAGSVTATHLITLVAPVTAVALTGPTIGTISQTYSFTATALPLSATLPITFSWSATGLAGEAAVVSSTTHVAAFTWMISGTQVVTVTAANIAGSATITHTIVITEPQPPDGMFTVYLPFLVRPTGGLTAVDPLTKP